MYTQKDFEDIIRWLKQENNLNGWNVLDIKCGELLEKTGSKNGNVAACAEAMLQCMLEGDQFLNDPGNRHSEDLEVRYYCDNLSPSRRKMF